VNEQGLTTINFPQLLFFILLLVEMKEDFLGSYPMLDSKGKPNAADELVCFQEAQTLPLFLVIPKTKPTFTPTTVKPPFNLVTQAPPSPLSSSTQNAFGGGSSSTFSSTMTRAAFENLDTQALVDYLIEQGVKLDDQKQTIFRQQDINGEVLLDWTREDLESTGLSNGIATMIMRRIPKE